MPEGVRPFAITVTRGEKCLARRRRLIPRKLQRRVASGALALVVAFAAWLGVDVSGLGSDQVGGASQQAAYTTGQATRQEASSRQTWWTSWDSVAYPDYYRVIGPAVVDEDVPAGTVRYADLDGLGRAGRCVANVTYQLMQEGEARDRDGLSDLHPSGWGHNAKVTIINPNGSVYNGYLYNRSHLVAKSLGGENRIENLVCGTRTQNVGDNTGQDGGMAHTETLARDWLKENPSGTVWYCATPIYEGSELLPRSVIVDIRTSDTSIDQEVEVYNVAYGFTINYATGEFSEY